MGLSDEELARKLQAEERRSSGRARRSSLACPAADTATSTRKAKEPKQPPTPAKQKEKETEETEETSESSPRKRTKLRAKAKTVSASVTTKHSIRSSWKLALVGEVSILDASVWGDYAEDEETKLWAEQNKGTKYEVKILAWEETATLSGRSTVGLYSVQHKDEAPFSLPLKVLLPGMSEEARTKVQDLFAASAQSKERKRQKLSGSADADRKDTKRQKSAASVDASEVQASGSEGESTTASETVLKPAVPAVSQREQAMLITYEPADPFASGGSWGQVKRAVAAPEADVDAFSAGGEWASSNGTAPAGAAKSSGGWGTAAVAAALAGDATSSGGWGSAASPGLAGLTASVGWRRASPRASRLSPSLHKRERSTLIKDQVAGFQRIDNCGMVVDQNVARLLASFSAACVANDRSAKDRLFMELTMAGCRVFEDPPTFALQPQTSPSPALAQSNWPSSPRGYANGEATNGVWGAADSNQREQPRWDRSVAVGPTAAGTDCGIAQNWNEEKGFGFIRPSDGGADIFCHCSAIVNAKILPVGSEVTYSVIQDARAGRSRATNVRVIEGAERSYTSAGSNQHSQRYHEHSPQAREPHDPAQSRTGGPSDLGGWGSTASDMVPDSFKAPGTVPIGERSRAGAAPSGFRGWRPQESSSGNQAAVIVLDDDENSLAGSTAMQHQQLQSQGGGTRMVLLQQHERQMQHRQRHPVAASQSTQVIELLDSDDEEEAQATRSSNSGDGAYDPCARNAFITHMVVGKAAVASPKNQSTSSKEATQGSKVVHLAFHQAKKDSFHPLGHLIALRSDSPGSAGWTPANIPAKITVLDKSVEPFFPGLENFPFIELRLPGKDAAGADKTSASEAARIEKFVTRVLRSKQTGHSSSQSLRGRNVAIMAVDWLRDTHPSTMARSELTGHLYLTPSPSLEDEPLRLRLYYASQGAPHR